MLKKPDFEIIHYSHWMDEAFIASGYVDHGIVNLMIAGPHQNHLNQYGSNILELGEEELEDDLDSILEESEPARKEEMSEVTLGSIITTKVDYDGREEEIVETWEINSNRDQIDIDDLPLTGELVMKYRDYAIKPELNNI